MRSTARTIPCPACGSGIPVEIERLIEGAAFACPICRASISIAPESREVARKAVAALQAIGPAPGARPLAPTALPLPSKRRK